MIVDFLIGRMHFIFILVIFLKKIKQRFEYALLVFIHPSASVYFKCFCFLIYPQSKTYNISSASI